MIRDVYSSFAEFQHVSSDTVYLPTAFAQLIGLALLGISPVERVRVLPPLPLRVCMK